MTPETLTRIKDVLTEHMRQCVNADGSIREMLGLSCTNVSSIGYGKYVHEDNGCIKGWVGRREGNQS